VAKRRDRKTSLQLYGAGHHNLGQTRKYGRLNGSGDDKRKTPLVVREKLTMIPMAVQRRAKYTTLQSSFQLSLVVVVSPLADLVTTLRVHLSG